MRPLVNRRWMMALMLALPVFSLQAADRIHVMILDGQSAGPYHAWQLTTPVLKKELEETGLFQIEVVTAPESGGDFTNFKPNDKAKSGASNQEWKKYATEMRDAAVAFADAAKGKNGAAVHKAAEKVNAACNSCHSKYRE